MQLATFSVLAAPARFENAVPHAGHGAIFQYHREFVAQALRFFSD